MIGVYKGDRLYILTYTQPKVKDAIDPIDKVVVMKNDYW